MRIPDRFAYLLLFLLNDMDEFHCSLRTCMPAKRANALPIITKLVKSTTSQRPWKSYRKDLARPVSRMPGSSRYRLLGGARVSIGRTITDFDLTFSLSI